MVNQAPVTRSRWHLSVAVSGIVHLAMLLIIVSVARQGYELPVLVVDLSNDAERTTASAPASSAAPRPTLSRQWQRHGMSRPIREVTERAEAAGAALDVPTPSPGASVRESETLRAPVIDSVQAVSPELARGVGEQRAERGGELPESASPGTGATRAEGRAPSDAEPSATSRGGGAGHDPDVALGGGVRDAGAPGDGRLGGGETRGGGAGPEYGPYLTLWRTRIQQSVRYPMAARRRNLAGTVHIEIVIEANGAVDVVKLVESSSHGILDTAVLESVKQLPPLPFPPHLVPRTIRARLPVVFEMR